MDELADLILPSGTPAWYRRQDAIAARDLANETNYEDCSNHFVFIVWQNDLTPVWALD